MLGHLSIRSKLLILLLLSGIGGAVILGTISLLRASDALRSSINDQLITIRETRKAEVERYFSNQQSSFAVFASQSQLIDTLNQFENGFRASGQVLEQSEFEALYKHYQTRFLPQLTEINKQSLNIDDYLPQSRPARRLQYNYIVDKKRIKDKLTDGQSGRKTAQTDNNDVYGRVHDRMHPLLSRAVSQLDLYDLFLIDHKTGDVLYSFSKEVDFATNLETGPYRNSGLARAFRLARDNPGTTWPIITDFSNYEPSKLQPASFIAMPVLRDNELRGIAVGQLSITSLNDTLTSDRKWKQQGLGDSGEVYLVGPDYKLRTDNRFYLEDSFGYIEALVAANAPEAQRHFVVRTETTILNQTVNTQTARKAISGETGLEIVRDFREAEVLSAYAPIEVAGLQWAILAEKNLAEAQAPMTDLRRNILLLTGGIAIALTLVSLLAAASFLRPINRLKEGVERVSQGDDTHRLSVVGTDEFAVLSSAFNDMIDGIRQRNEVIAAKTSEYKNLLRSILPEAVAARVSEGDTFVADTFENVTAIYANIDGFTSVMKVVDAGEMIRLMNELIDGFDEAAERHGVEKIKTVGDVYLAACGLPTPRLDHTQRAYDFALEMLTITDRFNKANNANFSLRVGMDCGEVDVGIVGRRRFVYEILGECVVQARTLALGKASTPIRLSNIAKRNLQDTDGKNIKLLDAGE